MGTEQGRFKLENQSKFELLKPERHQKLNLPVEMPMSFLRIHEGEDKPLLIFLHGYSDTGAGFVRRAFPEMDPRFEILAPNGLFPVPVVTERSRYMTYAWYFADHTQVVVSPEASAQALAHLLRQLGLEERPKILLGFSQGGFFIPFLLPHLKNVKWLFSIGAAYRPQDYSQVLSVPLDALHGDQDSVISLQEARESFARLQPLNPLGSFFEFPGLGHTMDSAARAFLAKRLSEVIA